MNSLKNETSPYLLQHAGNPVDWMPWGKEAFRQAEEKDRPVFLSIGYSTCHWCHVMERESFEDKKVAELLNNTFICIKVDREERPDIDKVYMDIAQLMTGRGGWPLSIFMTPEKKPFFAATYIPREDRYGQIGMLTLIPRIGELWKNKKDELISSASAILDKMFPADSESGKDVPEYHVLDEAFRTYSSIYDRQFGGFGNAPKFPSTHNITFLLHYWKKSNNESALEMALNTLDHMRYGGLWDHIGYGFHRYSTDRYWLVPHFEKMLYDQAVTALTYIDAYQATGKKMYRETAENIFDYVERNLSSKNGGFYSAEDADSEGIEGKFYLWEKAVIEQILGRDDALLFTSAFNITSQGNYKDEVSGKKSGSNIPHMESSYEDLSGQYGMDTSRFTEKLREMISKLDKVRQKRIRPFRDDKILTDWNALMIASFARGSRIMENSAYLDKARKNMDFLLSNMLKPDGRLFHSYNKDKASIDANLDDYSFMIMALIEIYQADFDYRHIKKALELNDVLDSFFWDKNNGGYYFTPSDNKDLIIRKKESYDGAIPSGNSIAVHNLIRLGKITMDSSLEKKASRTAAAFSKAISSNPTAHSQFLIGLDFMLGDSYEIILVKGKDEKEADEMIKALDMHFIPNKVTVVPDGSKDMPEFIRSLSTIDKKTTAYVCKNYYCKLPVNTVSRMLELLGLGQEQ